MHTPSSRPYLLKLFFNVFLVATLAFVSADRNTNSKYYLVKKSLQTSLNRRMEGCSAEKSCHQTKQLLFSI